MKLYIKNMVCDRCNMVIENQFQVLGYELLSVRLGEIELAKDTLSNEELLQIRKAIEPLGFELLGDRKSRLVDQIKSAVIELVHHQGALEKIKISDYLKEKVNQDYNYISQLFSSHEGVTIEQYFINQKIEKVKELLAYNELTTTEIAYQLGYSSLSHLSNQFKKVTGYTPSQYKKSSDNLSRNSLDKV
ncbi:MAG: AraC family transcriptional regulator [Gammaproteobacteria bacterium]|nr:AraC family transcriptional regulator [Gammaproteobacteria bacterium]